MSNIVTMNDWQRVCFMSMVGELGGITALLVFLIGPFVSTFNNFTLDNNMVRNLYTLPKAKGPSQTRTA